MSAPGYQSWAWTRQDWRIVQIRGGRLDWRDRCGEASNALPSGRKRLCLPRSVAQDLARTARGRAVLRAQVRAKEAAPPGARVRWHPDIRRLWRELEARTPADDPRRRRSTRRR